MDEILIRFPVVGQTIFKQLDDKNLAKSREVSKVGHDFLDNDSLLWRRRIQKYFKNQTEFSKDWKLVTNKTPIDILKKLAITVENFFSFNAAEELECQHSPLNIVAKQGMISLCK